ncbi:unnamed protein product [Boreogadus saida]
MLVAVSDPASRCSRAAEASRRSSVTIFSRGVWLQTTTHTLQTTTHTHFRCRQKHPPTRRKLRAGGCLERELHIIQQRPLGSHFSGPLDNIVAGVAWLRQNAGLLRGKVVEPAVRNMDPKEQQELLERIQDTDEEEKYPLLFTFDFQEDMEEVFHNMAAEEDLRVNAMFLGRWVDSQ